MLNLQSALVCSANIASKNCFIVLNIFRCIQNRMSTGTTNQYAFNCDDSDESVSTLLLVRFCTPSQSPQQGLTSSEAFYESSRGPCPSQGLLAKFSFPTSSRYFYYIPLYFKTMLISGIQSSQPSAIGISESTHWLWYWFGLSWSKPGTNLCD